MFIMRYFFLLYIYFFYFFSICITMWFVIFIFLIYRHAKMLWLLPPNVWNVAIFCQNIGEILLIGQNWHNIPYLLSVGPMPKYQCFYRFFGKSNTKPSPPVNAPIFAYGAFHFNFKFQFFLALVLPRLEPRPKGLAQA